MTVVSGDSKFGITKWIVSPSLADGATHTTIAGALSAASSGDVIYVRSGTYTENLTLTSSYNGVTITTYPDNGLGLLGSVKIVGKITASTVTNFVFQGIYFDDNGDNIFEDTGSATGTINFLGCQVEYGFECIEVNNANRVLIFDHCGFSRTANSINLFTATAVNTINFRRCIMGGEAFTPTASTIAAGTCNILYCSFGNPFSCSSTGKINMFHSTSLLNDYNLTPITTAGNQTSSVFGCKLSSGTAAAVSVGAGTTMVISDCEVFSSNANPVTGAGTIRYGAFNFTESGNGINVTTQTTAVTRAHQIAVKTGATIDEFSTDGTLAGNSDTALPTEKAVKTYVDASGGGGAMELIASATASASASISFTGLSSTYFKYVVEIQNVAPVTDGASLYLRTSTNGGSSYDSGASDYGWGIYHIEFALDPPINDDGDNADSEISIVPDDGETMGNAANEIASFSISLMNPSAATYFQCFWTGDFTDTAGTRFTLVGGGSRLTAADVDAIQFTMSSGNINTGTFKLYGISAS